MNQLKLLLFISYLLICSIIDAQNLNYVKQIYGTGSSGVINTAIKTDSIGNFFLTGRFGGNNIDFDPNAANYLLSSKGNADAFISKYDSFGNVKWVRTFGKANFSTYGKSLTIGKNGNIYFVGTFQDTVDFDPGINEYNLISNGTDLNSFILNLDSLGNFIWATSFKGNYNAIFDISLDYIGNIYLTGKFDGSVDYNPGINDYFLTATNSQNDVFVVKLNSNSDLVWAKSIAGNGKEESFSIVTDNQENVYFCGYFNKKVDFDPSNSEYFLTTEDSTVYDLFVTKLSKNGEFKWVKSAKSHGKNSVCIAKSMVFDSKGGLYITGEFRDTVDFDPGIDTLYITGEVNYSNGFILKLDSLGNFKWVNKINGSINSSGVSIAVDINDNIYVFGYYNGQFNLIIDQDTINLIGNYRSALMFRLTIDGNTEWFSVASGNQKVDPNAICTDINGNIYATGRFAKKCTFAYGSDTLSLTAINPFFGLGDLFVAKYSFENGNTIKQEKNSIINIYPNPCDNYTSIQFDKFGQTQIVIIDSNGKIIRQIEVAGNYARIDMSDLATGLYLINIYNSGELISKRIIKK